jgi:TolA-binding protein
MKKSRLYFLWALLPFVYLGCSETEKLEQENGALRAKLDSLEIEHANSLKQKAMLAEKVSSLEGENHALEKKMQEMTAKPEVIITKLKAGDAEQKPMEFDVIPAGQSVRRRDSTNASREFVAFYQEALGAFNARQYQRSMNLFRNLLQSPEKNDLRDNCEYWIGEALYGLKKYQEAVEQFTRVVDMKDADKRDAALVMRGNAYLLLHQKTLAQKDFETIINNYPQSEYVTKAKEKLAKLR